MRTLPMPSPPISINQANLLHSLFDTLEQDEQRTIKRETNNAKTENKTSINQAFIFDLKKTKNKKLKTRSISKYHLHPNPVKDKKITTHQTQNHSSSKTHNTIT